MFIHGREVKFLRTVWAVNEISKVCPNHNINKLSEALKAESTISLNEVWAVFISALSEGYEMAQKYVEKDYVPNPLTEEELYTLTEDDFSALISEATKAWFGDMITVEVEEPKKKEKTNETSD